VSTITTVEEYLASLPADRRAGVEAIGDVARAAAPEATLGIAYSMPALRLDGRFLVSWAAFKQHYSLFPASERVVRTMGDAVAPYVAGRGTFRFPAGRPLPLELIGRIIAIRLEEHRAEGKPARRTAQRPATGENEG
jgi:uncharacterized protein YdhG (YjbR/CyaY superfamily)